MGDKKELKEWLKSHPVARRLIYWFIGVVLVPGLQILMLINNEWAGADGHAPGLLALLARGDLYVIGMVVAAASLTDLMLAKDVDGDARGLLSLSSMAIIAWNAYGYGSAATKWEDGKLLSPGSVTYPMLIVYALTLIISGNCTRVSAATE